LRFIVRVPGLRGSLADSFDLVPIVLEFAGVSRVTFGARINRFLRRPPRRPFLAARLSEDTTGSHDQAAKRKSGKKSELFAFGFHEFAFLSGKRERVERVKH
jgi:hypothetical protein